MKAHIRIRMMGIYIMAVQVKVMATITVHPNKLHYKFYNNKKPAYNRAYNKEYFYGTVMRKECPHAYYLLIRE
jgi:hypothetical protein